MIEAQRTLLQDIRALEADARKLLDKGVKIRCWVSLVVAALCERRFRRSQTAATMKKIQSDPLPKITGVHSRLRAAGNELQTRLSYLEDEEKKPARQQRAPRPPQAPKNPEPDKTGEGDSSQTQTGSQPQS